MISATLTNALLIIATIVLFITIPFGIYLLDRWHDKRAWKRAGERAEEIMGLKYDESSLETYKRRKRR